MKFKLIPIFIFLTSFYANSQDFEYEKKSDLVKQNWLFSSREEADLFGKEKQKHGWNTNVKKRHKVISSTALYFPH